METLAGSLDPITPGSVVDLAYHRIRALIEDGDVLPGGRLRQGDLADALAISRTSVREALHRLTAESLVDFSANRGFSVASFRLDSVLERLELRLLLEPGIARFAAERRTDGDVDELAAIIDAQVAAASSRLAHDMSRSFHIRLARATRNEQFVRVLESLWAPDVGRELLARRSTNPGWKEQDAAEHQAILDAVAAGRADSAAAHMEQHLAATIAHWKSQATIESAGGLTGADSPAT